MTTVLAFLLALAILIAVHEWGHYRMAVACGVKVLRFSIGFGRVIWRRQRGADGTEFVLSALPLGGYVRMLDEREGPVAPEEVHRAFNRQSLGRRAAIVAAGPVANLLLAVLLYAGTWWIGVDEPKAVLASPVAGSLADKAGLQAGDWVRRWQTVGAEEGEWQELSSMVELRWQLMQHALSGQAIRLQTSDAQGHGRRQMLLPLDSLHATDADAALQRHIGVLGYHSPPRLGKLVPKGPAEAAGLRPGDEVRSVDGVRIADAVALREAIRASGASGRPTTQTWDVLRDGRALSLSVTPRVVAERDEASARAEPGKPAPTMGRIDAEVGARPVMVTVTAGPWEGLRRGMERTWEMASLSVRMLGRMLVGQASVRNLSGPLTIADHAGQSAAMGLTAYLGFLAMVSVSLGVLNLLPLPMLDGGHLMYYIAEALTGRPVSDAWLARLQRGGIAILLLLMSVALFNDVARLLGLH